MNIYSASELVVHREVVFANVCSIAWVGGIRKSSLRPRPDLAVRDYRAGREHSDLEAHDFPHQCLIQRVTQPLVYLLYQTFGTSSKVWL